jgi:hypothetical protein
MSEPLYTQEQLIRTRNENYNAGIKDERARIIKRLEADICPNPTLFCCDGACSAFLDAIALIKENE